MTDLTAKQIREGYDDVLMKQFEDEKRKMEYRKQKQYDPIKELTQFKVILKLAVWAALYKVFIYFGFGLLFFSKQVLYGYRAFPHIY